MKLLAVAGFIVSFSLGACQTEPDDLGKRSAESTTRVFATVDDLMHQVQVSRKAKRYDDAERQCLAAIQLLKESGWRPQGETATLGMIYYERGEKRLGFVTLRDSHEGSHGSAEAELYLGRMAIDLREYQTALEVVQRFRLRECAAGSTPNGTRKFWPSGNDVRSLQAIIEFLEGDRLCQKRETKARGIGLLLHANQLVQANVAINFSLGRAYQRSDTPALAEPFYRLVSSKGDGALKAVADEWLARNKKKLEAAAKGAL